MKKYINLASKVIKGKLFYSYGYPKVLPISFTFLISTKCNSQCSTCNIWKQDHDELNVNEWGKILRSIGNAPFWVTVSGGEPFLQPHLVDFCRLMIKHNHPAIINIPTNGILYQSIPQKVEEIVKIDRNTQIIINLSLDGVGKDHDQIRGVAGNFSNWLKTYKSLREMKQYKNFSLGIHSVISKFNVKKTTELFRYALSLNPDQYITEIAEERKELGTLGLAVAPRLRDYTKAVDNLKKEIVKRRFKGVSKFTEAFRLEYYQLVKRWLKEKKQIIPCYAGVLSCQISSWGEVWPCCVKGDSMGNLRNFDYNFKKVWFSNKAGGIRKNIKNKNCSCPLANSSYTNMLLSPSALGRVLRSLIKWPKREF